MYPPETIKIMKKIKEPLTKNIIETLRCGDEVLFSGIMYTARDQAHQRLAQIIKAKQQLPFDFRNQIIYYCGPNPARPGHVIGSCGPTTSSRMDAFTPLLLKHGLLAMVGKGERSKEVVELIKQYKLIYFATYAGCGAMLAQCVKSRRLVCFKDLGAEAIFALDVENFPLIVAIDSKGGSVYGS